MQQDYADLEQKSKHLSDVANFLARVMAWMQQQGLPPQLDLTRMRTLCTGIAAELEGKHARLEARPS